MRQNKNKNGIIQAVSASCITDQKLLLAKRDTSVQSMNTEATIMDAVTKFTCPLCNEEFYPEEEHLLREHMKAVHLEQMLAYHRQPAQLKTKRKIHLCFALGCSETNENKNLTFFYLPRRPRGLVWLINAGRYDMLSTPVELYVHHKICSKHFDIDVGAKAFKSTVSTKALPTIFTHSLEIMKNHAKGTQMSAKEPQYSNSLIEQFQNTVICERGSESKMFSITIVPVDKHFNHLEIKSRPATKVLKAGNRALIYTLLQGQDIYKISESIFRKKTKSNHKTRANKEANASVDREVSKADQTILQVHEDNSGQEQGQDVCKISESIFRKNTKSNHKTRVSKAANASADGEVSKADQTISEVHEDNFGQENYQIFSLADIDPLLHQDNCSSVLQLMEEINNNKETEIPEINVDDTVPYEQTAVPDLETMDISEDVALAQEPSLEHDYCSAHLCSINSLCRLCAKELQNHEEKSVVDVLQTLHPLFQKCLDLSQEFKESSCLPEKVCSLCVEKLQLCNTLFQQIAEANVKFETYMRWTQKHADSNNISEVGNLESDEQMKEDKHTLFGAEVTNECVVLDEPSEEPSESYISLNEPSEEPSESCISLNEPSEEPSESCISLDEPAEEPSESCISLDEPSEEPSESYISLDEPSEEPSESCISLNEPSEEPSESYIPLDEPSEEPSESYIPLDDPSEEPSESYICNECPESRVYKSQMDLHCHKVLVHEAEANSGDWRIKAYACKYCRRKFRYLKEFYHHPCIKKTRPNRPQHPPVNRILKTVYTRRYKRHADGYVCCTCGHIAPSEDDIKKHWKIHIPSLPPRRLCRKKEPIYGCHICGRRFTAEKYLTKHIAMHPNWKCRTCGKLFKSHYLLQTHQQKHQPDFTRLCYVCGKMYANIFQHIKRIHSAVPTTLKPRTYICHICGKVLTHTQHLKTHIYRVHEHVNKNIPCPHCQKTYFDEIALKQHIHRVHATPKYFKCDLCHMAYKTQVSLRKHVDETHLTCKKCQKRFPTNNAKNEHDILEHNEGSGQGQSSGTEDSMQERKELEETVYFLEDLQALSGSVQIILTTGDELFSINDNAYV